MKLGTLVQMLKEYDPEFNVRVRVGEAPDDMAIEQGDYLEVMDERSVTVEYGDVVIIADLPDPDKD